MNCSHQKISSDKRLYLAPLAEVAEIAAQRVVCSSPEPGGNENVGYENWNNW